MIAKIGFARTGRELEVDLGDDSEIEAVVKAAQAGELGDDGFLTLRDVKKGSDLVVKLSEVSYIEVSEGRSIGKVGFGA